MTELDPKALEAAKKQIILAMQLYDFGHTVGDEFFTTTPKIELLENRSSIAAQQAIRAYLSALPSTGWQPTHRHLKRGKECELVAIGKMQSERWREPTSMHIQNETICNWTPLVDMREVAIYVDKDGQHWVRPREESEDGRFAPLPATGE